MSGPPLTPRELTVLAAVERRLNNSEIASELFISVRTVESHIASLRRKLAAESRADLISAARSRRMASVRLPGNSFRGREEELSLLASALASGAQTTLVGPGGVGKTRLALEFTGSYDRTPVVVELEHATPEDIVNRVARALGLEASPHDDLLASIGVALAAQRYLLVLDNADHVGPATQRMVSGLRRLAPGLRVLATSRTPLGGGDEHVHTLLPLATDGVDPPAVALLTDRLTSAGHPPAPGDLVHIHHISARLEGLPLALELAAAAARHLPLEELSVRLDRNFAALDRAAPEGRHRTLETAFAWTWQLLTEEEREVLQRLAALPRTFDIELAVAVTHEGADGVSLRLLDRSLLTPALGTPGRWRLLAVLREFVLARTDPEVVREVRRRHTAAITVATEAFIAGARTDATRAATEASARLCPEVNAAVRWSLPERDPQAIRLLACLGIGVEQYGSDADSVEALALGARDPWVLAHASPWQLLALGNALAYFDLDLVVALAQRALACADAGDPGEQCAAHELAGLAAAYGPTPSDAFAHLDTAERLAVQEHRHWDVGATRQFRAVALRNSTQLEGRDGAIDEVVAAFETAMRAYSRAGDETHVNNVRYMVALTVAETGGDREQAARWAAECVAFSESNANEHELAHARLVQATLGLLEAGDLGELLDTFRHVGDLRCIHRVLMLSAGRITDPRARAGALREAATISATAGDRARQVVAVRALVTAQHDAGDHPATLAALDTLVDLAGHAAAMAACPPGLLPAFLLEHTVA